MKENLAEIVDKIKVKVKSDPNLEYIKEQCKYGGKDDNHKT